MDCGHHARRVRAQKAGTSTPRSIHALSFRIHAVAMGAHWASQLLDDRHAYSRARTIVIEKLRSMATSASPQLP